MITQLKGKLDEIYPSHAVIDCGGVGYWVNISLNTYSQIEREEAVKIYTYHLVREDQQALYGFAHKSERNLFELLISVNGVGPASALVMLSTLSADEIQHAIVSEDENTLKSVKGIGAKTAQRIIIDLKDKLAKWEETGNLTIKSENKIKFEALKALEVLGVSKKVAEKQIQKLLNQSPNLTVEQLIKETLKSM